MYRPAYDRLCGAQNTNSIINRVMYNIVTTKTIDDADST